jgi:hypothetical protein
MYKINPEVTVRQVLLSRFRCPEEFLGKFCVPAPSSQESGFFRVGDIILYGRCSSGEPTKSVTERLHDAGEHEHVDGSVIRIPYDPAQAIDNLCHERYVAGGSVNTVTGDGLIRSLYYRARPLMPVKIRKHLQRLYLRDWRRIPFPNWPVDRTVEKFFEHLLALSMRSRQMQRIPFIWFWPDGHRSCAVMTHDVETSSGRDFCSRLMDINDSFGIKSSFQIVPEERYRIPKTYLEEIRTRGFEVNVQDLNHDGHLYAEYPEFLRRTERIEKYRQDWNVMGFRAAVLYRNPEWYDKLRFAYDMSIPNVAHLDPQRGGCCTVFPFMLGEIVELPVTTIQDYSLFHILNDYSISLWRQQTSLIRKSYGLINIIVHPDYIVCQKEQAVYRELLEHLVELRDVRGTWFPLPRDVADWWRLRSELTLVRSGNGWRIRGNGAQRAQIAYASLVGDRVEYEISNDSSE